MADNVDTRLARFEVEIGKTQTLYEQYFAGVLKREPAKEREALKGMMRSFGTNDLKTTAYRFRFQSLQNRLTQLENLWSKTLKQIEEGTYRRDLFRLQAKEKYSSSEAVKQPETAPKLTALDQPFDEVYQKLVELSKNQKIPDRDKFIASLKKQVESQKQKNPDKGIELKLAKDASGKVSVKIKLKTKAAKV